MATQPGAPVYSSAGGGPDDPRVVAALQEYLAALEQGKRPDRAAFRTRYPELEGVLEDAFAGLDFLHSAAPKGRRAPKPLPPATEADAGRPNLPLGDYRLLR